MGWRGSLIYTALNIALAAVIAAIAQPGNRGLVFIGALVALELAPWLLALWTGLKFWVAYHAFLKRQSVDLIKREMRKHDLPTASAFFDHSRYLTHTIESDRTTLRAKLRASGFAAEIRTLQSVRPQTAGRAYAAMFQEAMKQHSSEAAATTGADPAEPRE
ncbi:MULTISPECIES: hypothetical protein [Ensifer]|uniref:hypothetical protein n=1 Tax=Ensifer TaxID=106591 RepID=UPI00080757A7|nr:hypothetical protein [Ensifer adhaerens]